ncbi:MAG: hypothetical protein NWE92_07590 [Candidatus Bathyarchaeota archaeon]|nr:hypothetical protein [Candidatus Bathyarchaeota archaeon]
MDKADFLLWSRKYDKANGWLAQRERELGAKFRKNKQLTPADLAAVVEWRYRDEPDKKERLQELVARNDPEKVSRITSQVLSLPNCDDAYRLNSLTMLEGVNPVLASIILAFFDPADYGVFDTRIWKPILGNPTANLYQTPNYLKLLAALRKTANKHNLATRTIDKALYKKSIDEGT